VRVTRSPSAGIVVGGPSEGRGAWLCRLDAATTNVDPECLDTALARRAFARAWRTELDEHDHYAIRTGLTGGDDQADAL
jgi:predicted RNA-binding protein YlxR (DUF448 family)